MDKERSTTEKSQQRTSSFKQKFCDIIQRAYCDKTIVFSPVDDWAYVLAISPFFQYSEDETLQIAKEIQQSILPNRYPTSKFQILTWRSMTSVHHALEPSYRQWYKEYEEHIDKGTKIVFFVNIRAMKEALDSEAKNHGFSTRMNNSPTQVIISDQTFEEFVDVADLASQGLWLGHGTAWSIKSCALQLPATFKRFHALYSEMSKAFPKATFWRAHAKIHVIHDKTHATVNYRQLSRALLFAQMHPFEWLRRMEISDLLAIDHAPIVSIRSPVYQKAYPKALVRPMNGYLLAAESTAQGRSHVVCHVDGESNNRFDHYSNEAQRTVHQRDFSARAFVCDKAQVFCAALVGDQIASAALYPALLMGALRHLGPHPKSVRAYTTCEDILIVADPNAPWQLIADCLKRARNLLPTIVSDGSDPLQFDEKIVLPQFPCGQWIIQVVPAAYFELIETASDPAITMPPGRNEFLRGLAYEIIHEWRLAVTAFRKAFRFDTTDGDINHALGRAMAETGDFAEAVPFLERAFRKLPGDAEVANTLGLAYLACDKNHAAVDALEHAVDIAPDDVQFLSNLGRCYFAETRFQDAERVLLRALQFAPHYAEAHATLAQIKWRLGDVKTARLHARKAFASNPGNKCMQDLLWALSIDDEEGA